MLSWIALSPFLLPNAGPVFAPPSFSWAQPPIGCVEDVIVQDPKRPCPDLSEVQNPVTDFPANMPSDERALWQHELKREMYLCRSREVLRREEARPGSMSRVEVEYSWMLNLGAQDTETKIETIYEASERFGVPPQLLLGALTQESLMADLGISQDGNNYSCGIGQLNAVEWCEAMQAAPLESRIAWDWPARAIARYQRWNPDRAICSLLSPAFIAPFYRIGMRKLGGLPEYRLGPEQMDGITESDVIGAFPRADHETQDLRFRMLRQFTRRCSDSRAGILAKAHELWRIYRDEVPQALKHVEVYRRGGGFERACREPDPSKVYPLQTAWLMADAIYNAGSSTVQAVAYYLRMDREAYFSPEAWSKMNPQLLIEALYGAGKYNPVSDLLDFTDLSGRPRGRSWFKACVVQRHIAHLVDHVTLPDVTITQSLEGDAGCEKSKFDGEGHLVRSGVPLERRRSSGQIPPDSGDALTIAGSLR